MDLSPLCKYFSDLFGSFVFSKECVVRFRPLVLDGEQAERRMIYWEGHEIFETIENIINFRARCKKNNIHLVLMFIDDYLPSSCVDVSAFSLFHELCLVLTPMLFLGELWELCKLEKVILFPKQFLKTQKCLYSNWNLFCIKKNPIMSCQAIKVCR